MKEIDLVTSGNKTQTEMACEILRAMFGEVKINVYRWCGPKKDAPELPYVRSMGEKYHGFGQIREFVTGWNENYVHELNLEEAAGRSA